MNASAYDWLQFNGDAAHSGNNSLEVILGSANVAQLTRTYHVSLPVLAEGAPALPNVRDYAQILTDLAVRRGLIRIGEDIVNTAYDSPNENPPKAQIEAAEKALYAIAETNRYGEGPLDFAESLKRTIEGAEGDLRAHEVPGDAEVPRRGLVKDHPGTR